MERLQAAIEKLEQLKADAVAGPWHKEMVLGGGNDLLYAIVPTTVVPVIGSTLRESDHDLIVTLHRTIDAQLAILRFAVDGLYDLPEFIFLADAILGSDS